MSQKLVSKRQVSPLLHCFTPVFYACKWLGIYPHDLQAFQLHTVMQPSKAGALLVICMMILLSVCFTLMLYIFRDVAYIEKQDNLSIIIGAVLSYISLAACLVDQFTAVRHQQQLGQVFERIQAVDEALEEQQISISNQKIMLHVRLQLALTFLFELTLCFSTYIMLLDIKTCAWLWFLSCLPTAYNSFDKIWFINLLVALQQRFEAMNGELERLVQRHEQAKRAHVSSLNERRIFVQQLATELSMKLMHNKVSPVTHKNYWAGVSLKPPRLLAQATTPPQFGYDSELCNVELIEVKFVQLCQLHNDICDIAKTLNGIWSLSILFLMAYGFLTITASLYFVYSASYDQKIPSLYSGAKQLPIAMLYLLYVAGKCITVMFYSWKTTLECRRTGICLHKCAVAVNTNEVYEIVNHLSLKLLHHGLDFSASEFFTLDMNTLFAICGGLTSYLIIFIQFDIAARQAKSENYTAPALHSPNLNH